MREARLLDPRRQLDAPLLSQLSDGWRPFLRFDCDSLKHDADPQRIERFRVGDGIEQLTLGARDSGEDVVERERVSNTSQPRRGRRKRTHRPGGSSLTRGTITRHRIREALIKDARLKSSEGGARSHNQQATGTFNSAGGVIGSHAR